MAARYPDNFSDDSDSEVKEPKNIGNADDGPDFELSAAEKKHFEQVDKRKKERTEEEQDIAGKKLVFSIFAKHAMTMDASSTPKADEQQQTMFEILDQGNILKKVIESEKKLFCSK